MARAIWKGAISFGLVYIPVELHTAARSHSIDLDYLDRRDFQPVGYQRVNKRSGKPVDWGDIVKGYQYSKGRYVALSDEDFRKANVKASRTIEILSFTDSASITPNYFETPYYLVPTKGGEKVYALLREALRRSEKVGVATFVIRSKQHLAVLRPAERAIMLNTLRFADEIVPEEGLKLPSAGEKPAGVTTRELEMAQKLIDEMSTAWKPTQYRDTYRDDLMEHINEKIQKHQTHTLEEGPAPREPRQGAQIIDLMSVLRKSLEQNQRGPAAHRKSDDTRGKRAHRTSRSRAPGRARSTRSANRSRRRA